MPGSSTTTTLLKTQSGRKVIASGGEEGNEAGKLSIPESVQEDFFWTYTEEPHQTRRLEIIKAHPEVWNANGSVIKMYD